MPVPVTIETAKNLYNCGDYVGAADTCKNLLVSNVGDIQALFLLGKSLCSCGNAPDALSPLGKVLQAYPTDARILFQYGLALRLVGRPEDALGYLRQAVAVDKSYYSHLELGITCFDSGRHEEAQQNFLAVLDFKSDCDITNRYLGRIELARGNYDEASDYLEKAITLSPNKLISYPDLIDTRLFQGRPDLALEVCGRALEVEPACTALFSMQYIAFSELGDEEGMKTLCDCDRLVKRFSARIPESFESTADFNAFLIDYILHNTHPTESPDTYTTTNGWQTEIGKLFESNNQLGAQVDAMFYDAFDRYIDELSVDADHPVNRGRPTLRHIEPWAVVLNKQGHQEPHMHSKSWLSGVYYVQLPETLGESNNDEAGWIAFGQAAEGYHKLRQPEIVTFKPAMGEIIVFPSYFWHHTIPFESGRQRICIAVDLVPTKGWGR